MAKQVVVYKQVSGSDPVGIVPIETSGYSKARIQTFGAVQRNVDVYAVPATLSDTSAIGTNTPDLNSKYLIGFRGNCPIGWAALAANVDILAPYLYVEISNYSGNENFSVVITLQE